MEVLLKVIPIAIPVILVIVIFLMGYVKAPPDVAYIISGLRKHPKVLIGRAGVKIPFLERVDKLIVRQISIDIKSEGYIPTQDFIGVDVDAVAKVRVMTDPEGIQLAMKNFLNMTEDDFNRAIVDSLQGNMREIIGTITLKEICNDRKKFGDEVQSKAQTDMNALGIQIISCNIQRVTDENSLINSLGQDNMSKIQKDAAIAKAEAERDIAIAQAQAAKASNDAQVESDMQIAHMIRQCRQGKIDLILAKSVSRFARNTVDTLQFTRELRGLGIGVIFEEQNINSIYPESEFLIALHGAFAQSESETISENVRWGKQQAMREGKATIFYPSLLGYKKGEDGKPVIVPEDAETIRYIYKSYLAGKSLRSICDGLTAGGYRNASGMVNWLAPTIKSILTNEKYCGDVLMQKTFIDNCISKKAIPNTGQRPMYLIQNHHEGIVSREIFDAVQLEIARRRAQSGRTKKSAPSGCGHYSSKYALSGLLFCGGCGSAYLRQLIFLEKVRSFIWGRYSMMIILIASNVYFPAYTMLIPRTLLICTR